MNQVIGHSFRKFWLLALLSLCLTGLVPLPGPVDVTHCGQIITTDAVLVKDLVCDTGEFESVAIEVNASNITLDLGGHVISGHPTGIGVRAMDVEGVTIRNGTIENFLSALDIVNTREVTVDNLTIRNLVADDPEDFIPGLRINQSKSVIVKESFFEFLPVAHKEAIVLADSEVTVDNVVFRGGSVGVNISGDSSVGNNGSTAAVINSHFVGVGAGVLIQFSEQARVANNTFTNCESGVVADLHIMLDPDGLFGITIESNFIDGGGVGIHFMGVSESSILNNVIRNYWRGIFLDANAGCPGMPPCFYSTGIVVKGNTVLGNFIDLYHQESALGNTWENNKCQTKEGAEIPDCTVLFLDGFEY